MWGDDVPNVSVEKIPGIFYAEPRNRFYEKKKKRKETTLQTNITRT